VVRLEPVRELVERKAKIRCRGDAHLSGLRFVGDRRPFARGGEQRR